jgi:hypothetical protein
MDHRLSLVVLAAAVAAVEVAVEVVALHPQTSALKRVQLLALKHVQRQNQPQNQRPSQKLRVEVRVLNPPLRAVTAMQITSRVLHIRRSLMVLIKAQHL